jgi:hypothetical protein
VRQYVALAFLGLNPDEVTAAVGVSPTDAHRAGDERAPGVVWRHHYWRLKSGVAEEEIDAATHFAALFTKLEPRLTAIRELADRCAPVVNWVVHVGPDERTPAGSIPRVILGKCCDIGAALDVDMYFDAGSGFVETGP